MRGKFWKTYINIGVDMNMNFTVEFYETEVGACPVREFMDKLKTTDPDDFAAVVAGLAKLRNRLYHREPLAKSLGGGLFELRHVGKLNTRVLWFFVKNHRIVAVHGIRNKGQAIPDRDIRLARERMKDWQKRVER
ncbi:MAG: type II toxin-antitoxin system RelE/ParE family toxin [Nitrospirae bacterium]|nr:type II toxin-antitoxin system RelE/ParE family toxin [Nitrospirota bacterium]